MLVLSDRISQLDYLQEKLGYGVKIDGTMTSKKNKELREQYIQDMREGKEQVIYASFGLAKEGLDIPRLDTLILASPHKDRATIIQAVGRIERKFEGKIKPIVYDIVDKGKYFEDSFKTRKRYYKQNRKRNLDIGKTLRYNIKKRGFCLWKLLKKLLRKTYALYVLKILKKKHVWKLKNAKTKILKVINV